MHTTRRDLLGLGLVAASATASVFRVEESEAQTPSSRYREVFPTLDRFIEQYMRDMNSPGMTLVLADRDGIQRVATYGFNDLERQRLVAEKDLFQIGSITKSFTALVLLQLHEEGKLDFNKPIRDYLPWFRIDSKFAPITVHHLLTHSSGVPGGAEVFPAGATEGHLAAYAPGEHFDYNNMGYTVLGLLAWTLDGRELAEQYRERIFKPLGMKSTEATIDFDNRERLAKSYAPFTPDRPYTRHGRLCEAPAIITTSAAGSIAATARDMGAYVHMLANKGRGLISPASFERFSKRQIEADEFGPNVGYGYGIAIDELEGHKLLRHTGGMISFMSSLMIDIDAGLGGFASINAQQGYRPNPVMRYALQLMRARNNANSGAKPLPPIPPVNSAAVVENAADFVGGFTGPKGTLEFVAEQKKLFLVRAGKRLPLERLGDDDHFHVPDASFDRFALVFGRQNEKVVEVGWADDWYASAAYDGPREFTVPANLRSYVGHYRNESAWTGSLRIVVRKGRLLIDGATPLEAVGDLFRLRASPFSTDWIRFGEVVNGKCMRLSYSGAECRRVMVP
jgi:CubicO group peptidase (beta-lactamase class C family)